MVGFRIFVSGATYPFGMVQFTPTYFTKQLGFVINQLSGAGCDHMGNFPTLPIAGALRVSPDSILNMQTPVGKEIGTAGYYAATVDHSIRAELNRYGTYGYGSLYVFFQGKAGYRDYRRRSSCAGSGRGDPFRGHLQPFQPTDRGPPGAGFRYGSGHPAPRLARSQSLIRN